MTLRRQVCACRLAGGLAWLGVLTFGVVSEQVKTRLEERSERAETQVGSLTAPSEPAALRGNPAAGLARRGNARPSTMMGTPAAA